MNLSDSVLVARLVPHLPDPFKILGVPRDTNFDRVKPQVRYVNDSYSRLRTERDQAYSRGRIRYFRDLFLEGEEVTPLEVDNEWSLYSPCGLILNDGHHRLCGAILAGSDHVVVSYSGDVRALRWLKGELQTAPEWLE